MTKERARLLVALVAANDKYAKSCNRAVDKVHFVLAGGNLVGLAKALWVSNPARFRALAGASQTNALVIYNLVYRQGAV